MVKIVEPAATDGLVIQRSIQTAIDPKPTSLSLKAPSTRRTVVFSPHNQNHPYNPALRPALSSHPRSFSPAHREQHPGSDSPKPPPNSTPTRGILKRTDSGSIRLAKDLAEGTRINGRSERRAWTGTGPNGEGEGGGTPTGPTAGPSSSSRVGGQPSSSPSPHHHHSSSSLHNSSPTSSPELSTIHSIRSHLLTIISYSTSPKSHHLPPTLQDLTEAYSSLTVKFRPLCLGPDGPSSEFLAPLGEFQTKLIKAFKRDLGFLFKSEGTLERERRSSPSEVADAAVEGEEREGDGEDKEGEDPGEEKKKIPRKGLSEEEVVMRREEVLVGQAALKWLALCFHVPGVWGCFYDDEIMLLLRIILRIPVAAATGLCASSASKRTYAFSIYCITYFRLPNRILKPLAEQVIDACKRATSSNITASGQTISSTSTAAGGKKGGGGLDGGGGGGGNQKAKVEGLGAVYNVLSRNASVFLPYSEDLLPILLKGLVDKTQASRSRSTAGLGAAILKGREWVAELEQDLEEALAEERRAAGLDGGKAEGRVSKAKKEKERKRCEEELRRARKVVEEDVPSVVTKCLKRKTVAGGDGGSGVGEEKMLTTILGVLKGAAEKDAGAWAVSTWAVLVTLHGKNISANISDLLDFISYALSLKTSPAFVNLCRLAWDHFTHALVSQNTRRLSSLPSLSSPSISPANDSMIYDCDWMLGSKRTKLFVRYVASSLSSTRLDPSQPQLPDEEGAKKEGPVAAGEKLMLSLGSLTTLLYALSGAVLNTASASSSTIPDVTVGDEGKEKEGKRSAKEHPTVALLKTSSTGQILVPSTPPTSGPTTSSISSSSSSSSLDPIRSAHLSSLFDEVIQPLLIDILSFFSLDAVNILGWSTLLALFQPSSPSPSSSSAISTSASRTWKLDRLLCESFLKGEVSSADLPPSTEPVEREKAMWELAQLASANCVGIEELSSLPREWIASRVSNGVVKLFETAVLGMKGLKDVEKIEWKEVRGVKVLARPLSTLWNHILSTLASLKPQDSTRPPNDYLTGILEVTRFINFIFKADVSTYYPPSLEQAGVNPDLVRYGLVEHLVSVAIDVLGEEAFSKTLPFKDNMVLGAGKNGSPTSAGILITSLIQTKLPSFGDSPLAREAFTSVLTKLVDVGVSGGLAFNLLGDLTTNLDGLANGEDEEAVRMDLWQLVASKWSSLYPKQGLADSVPSSQVPEPDDETLQSFAMDSIRPPSMTLTLLTNLLTDPFRRFPSTWERASEEQLDIWRGLLETTIERSRVKQIDPNISVVESLAAGLADAEMTESPSRPSLECLVAITSSVRFPTSFLPTNDPKLAFNRRMKNLPDSFLQLLRDALNHAYESVATHPDQQAKSIASLIRATAGLLRGLPMEFVGKTVDILAPAVLLWVRDEKRVLTPETHESAPAMLYDTILTLLAGESKTKEGDSFYVVPRTSQGLKQIAGLLCASVTAPHGTTCVEALETFWSAVFKGVENLEYPSNLKQTLKGLEEVGLELDTTGLEYSQTQSVPTPNALRPNRPPDSVLESQDVSRKSGDSSYEADTSTVGLGQASLEPETFDVAAPNQAQEAVPRDPPAPRSRQPSVQASSVVDAPVASNSTKRKRGGSSTTDRPSKRQSIIPATPFQPPPNDPDNPDIDESALSFSHSITAPAVLPDSQQLPTTSTPRALRSSASSSSVLKSAVSWIPRLFRSPASARHQAAAGDLTLEEEEAGDVSHIPGTPLADEEAAVEEEFAGVEVEVEEVAQTESMPVTEKEEQRASRRRKSKSRDAESSAAGLELKPVGSARKGGRKSRRKSVVRDESEEERVEKAGKRGSKEGSTFREEEAEVVAVTSGRNEADDTVATDATEAQDITIGSPPHPSTNLNPTPSSPKSARKAQRQLERSKKFGNDPLIDTSLSLPSLHHPNPNSNLKSNQSPQGGRKKTAPPPPSNAQPKDGSFPSPLDGEASMPSSDVTNGDGEDIEMDLSRVDENHYEDEDEERVEPTGLGNLGDSNVNPGSSFARRLFVAPSASQSSTTTSSGGASPTSSTPRHKHTSQSIFSPIAAPAAQSQDLLSQSLGDTRQPAEATQRASTPEGLVSMLESVVGVGGGLDQLSGLGNAELLRVRDLLMEGLRAVDDCVRERMT